MSSGEYLSPCFLFINLGCEMVSILISRLEAQKIAKQKMNQIIDEITGQMFKEQFFKQIIEPQQALTVTDLKEVFKRLAHSSSMRLDHHSMEKLFYLMLLTIKKQFILTSSPYQIYGLTRNYLKSVSEWSDSQNIKLRLNLCLSLFTKMASNLTFMQYFWIKQQILSILEPYQTKIVTFIQAGYQTDEGEMVFYLRNHHNQKSLGCAINHPIILIQSDKKNSSNLLYKDFTNWKTQLGPSSKPLNVTKSSMVKRSQGNTQNGKSMRQTLGIKKQNLDDFKFTLEVFSKNDNDNEIKNYNKKQKEVNTKLEIKQSQNKDSFKKIEEEFSNLNFQEQEQIDLLELMDSKQ